MRRRPLVLLTLLALAAPLAATPASGGERRGLAEVRVAECQIGDGRESRRVEFDGRMAAVPGTRRMAMRFTLLERRGSGVFRRTDAPGLGVWRRSRPGVARFVYRQEVSGLAADAAYRVEVEFRWLGADGRVLRSARRRSPSCRQAAVLPNLVVRSLELAALDGDAAEYRLLVANVGGSPVNAADVTLSVDGGEPVRALATELRPLRVVELRLRAPACTHYAVAAVDPENRLRESDERDNARTLACP